jgi:hypothetical protein
MERLQDCATVDGATELLTSLSKPQEHCIAKDHTEQFVDQTHMVQTITDQLALDDEERVRNQNIVIKDLPLRVCPTCPQSDHYAHDCPLLPEPRFGKKTMVKGAGSSSQVLAQPITSAGHDSSELPTTAKDAPTFNPKTKTQIKREKDGIKKRLETKKHAIKAKLAMSSFEFNNFMGWKGAHDELEGTLSAMLEDVEQKIDILKKERTVERAMKVAEYV